MNGDVIKDTDRGALGERAKDTDRGLRVDRGDSSGIANDLFQRASQLGGLLVVAFVAPIGPSAVSRSGTGPIQRALLGIGEAAAKEQPPKDEDEKPQAQKARSPSERRAMIAGRK
jgi:hypothetical protein